ncbi:MAG: Maf family protein [Chloroflexota bacterium]
MKKIVLASASPRRAELLKQIGLKFVVDPSNHEETLGNDLPPERLVMVFSLKKARAVARRHRNAVVIAADTIGVLNGKTIGKPRSAADARRILQKLSGRTHSVTTGLTVIDTDSGRIATRAVETKVHFKKLTSGEINAYVKTGEPMDKAGAYGIQERGAIFVDRIEGDYFNVIGLPLCALAETLKKFGVEVMG